MGIVIDFTRFLSLFSPFFILIYVFVVFVLLHILSGLMNIYSWAAGIERVALLCDNARVPSGPVLTAVIRAPADASTTGSLSTHSLRLSHMLRLQGIPVIYTHTGNTTKQLKQV